MSDETDASVVGAVDAGPVPDGSSGDEADGGGGSGDGLTTRGQRTAQRLRRSARRVFERQGFVNARVEDIVADAGVSHGTFYTYYDNKADILDALVDETEAALLAVAEESWEGPDATATVGTVISRFLEVFMDDADVVAAWIQATAHESHFRDRLREVREGYTQRTADQLRPVLVETPHDPAVAAAALVALVEGYATQGLADASVEERAEAVRTLTAIWVGGVRELATSPPEL